MIPFPLDDALNGFEVTAGEFVREAEERLVLKFIKNFLYQFYIGIFEACSCGLYIPAAGGSPG